MMESRAQKRGHPGAFRREKSPSRSKNDAPGFATPLAPSESGAYSDRFGIRKWIKAPRV